MNDAPHRFARKLDFSLVPGLKRASGRLRTLPAIGALLMVLALALALAIAPAAGATTGGAESSVPVAAPAAESSEAPVANEAELSFMPFRYGGASWYGGTSMWGRSTACGQVLRPTTIGVANKTLPCGTPVKFVWHGHSIVAPVIDRGPYVKGRSWDLTLAAAEALEFEGIGRIQYAVAIEYAAKGL